jgi:glycosyltransferase involved in cell wall biosynthesis
LSNKETKILNKQITVLLVSTSYPSDKNDWRGRFIANVAKAISHYNNINVNIWAPPGQLPENVNDISNKIESKWLKQLMVDGGIAHLLRSKGPFAIKSIFKLILYLKHMYIREQNVDVFHINWLQNAIPLRKSSTPALISVLGSDLGLLKFFGMKFLLRNAIRKRKCIIAPNADWMVSELHSIFGDIAEIRSIPFGVDKKWFNIIRQHDDAILRWICVTRLTKKKIGTLFKWGNELFKNNNELHLFGPMQENIQLPCWINYHGPVSPDELLSKWFTSSSGLISLSLHDEGRPQVILEAMAAGLPIIATPLKAHKDVICDRKTGCIVSSFEEFKNALFYLSNPDNNSNVGVNAKNWIIDNIGTWDDCAKRYLKAYKDLI